MRRTPLGSSDSLDASTNACSVAAQIVLATLPPQYVPGDYAYPFQYQLPATLPGTIAIYSSPDGMNWMRSASAEIKYKLEVRLRANGFLVADLSAQYKLRVHARPHADDNRAIEGNISESVRFLGLFKKGTCDITAVLDQRALVAGSSVIMRPQIQNNTRWRLGTVSLRLIQTIELSGAGEHTHTIRTRELPGVNAREYFTQELDLAIPSSLEPTCATATLFGVYYTLRVKCSYSGCPGAYLDFPLTVLPRVPDYRYLQHQLAYGYVPLAIPIGGG